MGDHEETLEALTAQEAAVLGGGLPAGAGALLAEAARAYGDAPRAEALLLRAGEQAPDHAAVLVGLYRFYFYQGRLAEALSVAGRCLARGLSDLGLGADWRSLRPGDAPFSDYGAVLPRFLLFSLKGHAYLSMRLGDLAEGRRAVDKLLELDPTDKLGARLLLEVLRRREAGED